MVDAPILLNKLIYAHWSHESRALDQFASVIQKLYFQRYTTSRRTVVHNGAVPVPRDFVKGMAE
jgi:hypothetical protein